MASKSAAAYREAQTKGTPAAAGGGHQHGAAPAAASSAAVDHSAHGSAADPHAGMDHGSASPAAVDHAAMGHGTAAHAGMDHGTASPAAVDHAAMGHGTAGRRASSPHAQHGAAAHTQHRQAGASQVDHSAHSAPATSTDPHAAHREPAPASTHAGHTMPPASGAAPTMMLDAPTSNVAIGRTQPSGTLQPDEFDAPAASAVAEARKAADGESAHENHGAASEAVVYACPMHPEVTSTAPGTCPKCGMRLVKKEK